MRDKQIEINQQKNKKQKNLKRREYIVPKLLNDKYNQRRSSENSMYLLSQLQELI